MDFNRLQHLIPFIHGLSAHNPDRPFPNHEYSSFVSIMYSGIPKCA